MKNCHGHFSKLSKQLSSLGEFLENLNTGTFQSFFTQAVSEFHPFHIVNCSRSFLTGFSCFSSSALQNQAVINEFFKIVPVRFRPFKTEL